MSKNAARRAAFDAWKQAPEGSEEERLAAEAHSMLNHGHSVDGVLDHLWKQSSTEANSLMLRMMSAGSEAHRAG